MMNKGFNNDNDISEQSKEALQSETWQKVRASARHFVTGAADGANAYPTRWGMLVNKYLSECYRSEEKGHEVNIDGRTYQVLKREKVTAFYDHDGNTLFDVENERLTEEAEFYEDKQEETDSGDSQEEITETSGEEDIAEPSRTDGNGNTGEEKKEAGKEVSKADPEVQEPGTKEAQEETNIVPVPDNIGEKAEEKLRKELGKADDKKYAEPIIEYLIKRCLEDKGLAEDVMQKHKSWKKCFDYIYSQARKQAKGNCAMVRDDVVYEWAEDYYHKDDKAENEKKAKASEERKKKEEERKKKAVEKKADEKQSVSETKKKNPEKKTEKPKKNSKDIDGQMDMFAMMGM